MAKQDDMLIVRYKGRQYLFTANSIRKEGALCSIRQFKAGEAGFGQLDADGVLWRYRERIGTRKDLTVVRRRPAVMVPLTGTIMATFNLLDAYIKG